MLLKILLYQSFVDLRGFFEKAFYFKLFYHKKLITITILLHKWLKKYKIFLLILLEYLFIYVTCIFLCKVKYLLRDSVFLLYQFYCRRGQSFWYGLIKRNVIRINEINVFINGIVLMKTRKFN